MSAGTRVYPVRLPPALVAEIEVTIRRRNLHSREAPWTLSDFIRTVMVREMRKMARSRAPRGSSARRSRTTSADSAQDGGGHVSRS